MSFGVFVLEIIVILFAVGIFYYMKNVMKYKDLWFKFIILFISVLLFEIMSEPMWINKGLDTWSYLFRNVSWIVTLGWVDIFLVSMLLVDNYFKDKNEKHKFWLYLVVVTIITTPIEAILLGAGIREYAQVLTSTFSGLTIPILNAPIEVLLAVPMISALIIPFYKYFTK